MAEARPARISPLAIVGGWLVFSVALAAWWVIFAYRFITQVMQDQFVDASELEAKQRMLVYEGVSLILCLLAGGGALAYYVLREYRRNQQIREFFAAFTHDLKTPIASLRLQAESLGEDLESAGEKNIAKRLVGDTLRLELQLENSLFLANLDSLARLHIEEVRLKKQLERIAAAWPELKLECSGDAWLRVDVRAFETILKNLANNSLAHGRATKIEFLLSTPSSGRVGLKIVDNGNGHGGDISQAGKLFARSGKRGGSGIGLYLVRSLTEKMGGRVGFSNQREPASGFIADFEFTGRLG